MNRQELEKIVCNDEEKSLGTTCDLIEELFNRPVFPEWVSLEKEHKMQIGLAEIEIERLKELLKSCETALETAQNLISEKDKRIAELEKEYQDLLSSISANH